MHEKPRFSKFSADKKKHENKKECGCSSSEFVRSNGEILVVVQRSGFNITTHDLPYFIFGYLYLQQGAASMYNLLKPLLNGLSLDVSIINNEMVNFVYSIGPKTDTITVFFPPPYSLISYVDFIQSLPTNSFRSNLMTITYNYQITDFAGTAGAKTNIGNMLSLMGCPFYFYEVQSSTNVGGSKMAHAIYPAGRMDNSQNMILAPIDGAQNYISIVDVYLPEEKINMQTAWIHFFKSGLRTGDGYIGYLNGVMINTINILLSETVNLNDKAEQVYNANTK